ncbi:MAG: hypothetical protein Q9169_005790 [Polycauliona sp. 2 TL-2023]
MVGVGCRLPGGVHNTETLWKLLLEGRNAWSPVPKDRYNEVAFIHPSPDHMGTTNHHGGHFLHQDLAAFDADFFGISPAEAKAMDPQQRFLLETAYEAFEDAGITLEQLRGSSTAVYAANFTHDYDRNIYKDPLDIPKYHTTGCGDAILSNRISYVFDLKGPSMTLDTGCSGSMVALHQACQSLRSGESSLALACGVNLIMSPDHMIAMSNLQYVLSRVFERKFTKREHQLAQEALYRSVYSSAGLDPTSVDYIEAHGTGTLAGDTAELQAIASVFGKHGDPPKPLYVGSIKSNIGHLEASSGLAGLVKSILILERNVIPPNADFQTAKDALNSLEYPIHVPTHAVQLSSDHPHRISINSFGYGGMNAHAILETPPHERAGSISSTVPVRQRPELTELSPKDSSPLIGDHGCTEKRLTNLFVLSANSLRSLIGSMTNLALWLSSGSPFPTCDLEQVAMDLISRRSLLQWRHYFVADSSKDLIHQLTQSETSGVAGVRAVRGLATIFIFTGQSAQWYCMGKELFDQSATFRQSMIVSDRILHGLGAQWNLINELYTAGSSSRINEGEIAQPATTAIQIALVDLLTSINIRSQTVVGHSSGEIAAAYSAGSLSQQAALKIAYFRGHLSQISKRSIGRRGAMLSVGLGEAEVLPFLTEAKKGLVSVACLNSPRSSTVSGDETAIDEVAAMLNAKAIFNRKLQVDAAYHSHHMRSASEYYRESLGDLQETQLNGDVAFISSVTGAEKKAGFSSTYWIENLVSKVRFSDALDQYRQCSSVERDGEPVRHLILEIGPHGALRGPIQQILSRDAGNFDYVYMPTLERGQDGVRSVLDLAGRMFLHGYQPNLGVLCARSHDDPSKSSVIQLPGYSWDHQKRYWHESQLSVEHRQRQYKSHDLLGIQINDTPPDESRWRHVVNLGELPWLAEHVVDGLTTFPGAGFLCMAIEALKQITNDNNFTDDSAYLLQDVAFTKALVVPDEQEKLELQLCFSSHNRITTWHDFRIFARSADHTWHEHCHGRIMLDLTALSATHMMTSRETFEERYRSCCTLPRDSTDLYEQLHSGGNTYGPLFASIKNMALGEVQAISDVMIPRVEDVMPSKYQEPHVIHPTTLDSLMHTALPIFASQSKSGSIMPVSVEQLRISTGMCAEPGKELRVFTASEMLVKRYGLASCTVFEKDLPSARPVLVIEGMKMLGISDSDGSSVDHGRDRNIGFEVQWAQDVNYAGAAYTIGDSSSMAMEEYCKLLQFKFGNLDVLHLGIDQSEDPHSIARYLPEGKHVPPTHYDIVAGSPQRFEYMLDSLRSESGVASVDASSFSFRKSLEECGPKTYDIIFIAEEAYSTNHNEAGIASIRRLLKGGGHLLLNVDHADLGAMSIYDSEQFMVKHNLTGRLQIRRTGSIKNGARSTIAFRDEEKISTGRETSVVVVSDGKNSRMRPPVGDALTQRGIQYVTNLWDTMITDSNTSYIFLLDGKDLGLCDARSTGFEKVRDKLSTTSAAVWVILCEGKLCPDAGVLTGLLRTACSEFEQLRTIIFEVQDPLESSLPLLLQPLMDAVLQLVHPILHPEGSYETEYVFSEGRLLIPRLLPSTAINDVLASSSDGIGSLLLPYSDESCPLKLSASSSPAGKNIYFERDNNVFANHVGDDEVIVEVHAQELGPEVTSLAPASSQVDVQGFAGIVAKTGKDAQRAYRIGDRIYGWSFDATAYPSHRRSKTEQISHVPSEWETAFAAMSPLAIMTAYHILEKVADLRPGQTILLHGTDSLLIWAAIEMSRYLGAKVLVSGIVDSRLESIAEVYDLPPSHLLAESGTKLHPRVQSLFKEGVDVILCASHDPPPELWACVKIFGKIIQVKGDGNNISRASFPLGLDKPFTFVVFDMVSELARNAEGIANLLERAQKLLDLTSSTPSLSFQKTSISNLQEAINKARTRSSPIKTILEGGSDTPVKVKSETSNLQSATSSYINSSATYVVAGGLGDVGHVLCRLLALLGARNIVVLSRRTHEEKQEALQDTISAASSCTKLHVIKCDISKLEDVDRAAQAISDLGLPSVAGVIQAAAVLEDCTLERMTAHQFHLPLLTKVDGTRHLHQTFSNGALDFFIMLSSVSGIVGSRGQANYVGGNVFQDRFAWALEPSSKIKYLAVDLGLVQSTANYHGENGQRRQKNLLYQGLLPIDQDQTEAILRYALTCTSNAGMLQLVVGFDGKSLQEADGSTPATRTPMFRHVRGSTRSVTKRGGQKPALSLRALISSSQNQREALKHTTEALSLKVSQLISLGQDRAPLDKSLLDFGIDSLTAIDLKSWIQKEFGATLQPSEILDEPSLQSLGKRILSKSDIAQALLQSQAVDAGVSETSDLPKYSSPTAAVQQRPVMASTVLTDDKPSVAICPTLPLIDLQSALDMYLAMVKPVITPAAFEQTRKLARQFLEGPGPGLHARLSCLTTSWAKASDSGVMLDPAPSPGVGRGIKCHLKQPEGHTPLNRGPGQGEPITREPVEAQELIRARPASSWQHDLQASGVYLAKRQPIHPYGTFFFSHSTAHQTHSQPVRAALVSLAAYGYKNKLESGQVLPHTLNGERLCMSSQDWLFNTNRTPCRYIDKMEKHPHNDHVVALRQGHFFKISLAVSGESMSWRALASAFGDILERLLPSTPSVSSLTADERDSWADLREELKTCNPRNVETLQMIEAAAFIVCLDDSSPLEPSDRCNSLLLGSPASRWSDKTLQFIIHKNGSSGHVCEHSMLDALSLIQLNAAIQQALAEPLVVGGIQQPDGSCSIQELSFTLNANLRLRIQRIEADFTNKHLPCEVSKLNLPKLSASILRHNRIPAKSGMQLVTQLACLMYYGRQRASWETVSLMRFHTGRLDWIQTITPAMKSFCHVAALESGAPDDSTLLTLLHEAANTHASLVTRTSRGRGCMGYLEALREVVRNDDGDVDVPNLFQDPTWTMATVTSPRKIKTDASEGLCAQEAGFYMPDPESVLIHYEFKDTMSSRSKFIPRPPHLSDDLIPNLVDKRAELTPNHTYAEYPVSPHSYDQGFRSITYHDLANAINGIASWLRQTLGSSQTLETLAYIGPNDLRYPALILGAVKAGYAVILDQRQILLTSPRNSMAAHASLFNRLDCTVLLSSSPQSPAVSAIEKDGRMRILEVPELGHLLDIAHPPFPYQKTLATSYNDPLFIVHTSGTTGIPKPIIYTHATAAANMKMISLDPPPGFESQDKLYQGAYLASFLFNAISFGTIMVAPTSGTIPSGEGLVAALLKTPVDVAIIVPSIVQDLAENPHLLDLCSQHLNALLYCGGDLPQSIGDIVASKIKLVNQFGATELGLTPNILSAHRRDLEDWKYVQFHPKLGFEMRPVADDTFELFAVRSTELRETQPTFTIFPDTQEYGSRDLFVRHPSPTKKDLWKWKARADDIIVFLNGEKTNPISMEQHIISSNPVVLGALVFGAQRFQAGLLIEVIADAKARTSTERAIIIEKIWPTITDANRDAPSHARITRSHILFTSPEKPMMRAGKGTIQRASTLKAYEAEIDALYRDADQMSTDHGIESVASQALTDQNSMLQYIRKAIASITGRTTLPEPDENIFDTGMDSLHAVILVRQLKGALGVRELAPSTIYTSPTPEALTQSIISMRNGWLRTQQSLIDNRLSERGTLLQEYKEKINQLSSSSSFADNASPFTVVLTGSTGGLGSHLLKSLLAIPAVSDIVCLNRAADGLRLQQQRNAERQISLDLPTDRVTLSTCDLSKADLGIPVEIYDRLISSRLLVVHNAWPVNFNLTIDTFRPQLDSIINLAELVVRSKQPSRLFFISSISSVMSSRVTTRVPEDIIHMDGIVHPNGYAESKYLSEMLLHDASGRLSVGCSIARVGQLTGASKGFGAWNRREWFPSLVISSAHIGAVPDSLGGSFDEMDWIPIDLAAETIAELAIREMQNGHRDAATQIAEAAASRLVVYHIVNPQIVHWRSMRTIVASAIARRTSKPVEIIDSRAWIAKVRDNLEEMVSDQPGGSGSPDIPKALEMNPAAKLLDFFKGTMCSSGGPSSIKWEMKRTLQQSRLLHDVPSLNEAWMDRWVGEWLSASR